MLVKKGWSYRFISNGEWRSGKFHYFKGNKTICGKYTREYGRLPLVRYNIPKKYCCKECMKKLKKGGWK